MAQNDGGSAQRRSHPGSQKVAVAKKGVFVCNGEYWTIGYADANFSLKDIKGLGYLQRLLQHPGEEFHSLDLLNGPGAAGALELDGPDKASLLGGATVSVGGLGDAGEMLDAKAKQDYQRRLIELREELEDLHERGDERRAAQVESEIDFLHREIARAVGLGGRDRRAGSAAERARLNVTRAIKSALQKISEHNNQLGELLDRSIRTGSFSCYLANPQAPIAWQFSVEGIQSAVGAKVTAPVFSRPQNSLVQSLGDRTAFVGREEESAVLRRLLERALGGEGGVAMIGGALGVGKTRISAEFAAEASQRGFITLVGSCYDRENSLPFNPFVEILESAMAQSPSQDAFRAALGDDAGEMARLMPQLRHLFPDIPPPLEISPEQSRRILFNAVVELLARTATTGPILLLFEDLHWADEGTLSLLNHIARSISKMPVLMVGTFRDNEINSSGPFAQTLDELLRIHMLKRISLRGLPLDAVAEMIRALSGKQPPPPVVSLIYSGTEGNPFFVEELFRHLVERGRLLDAAGEFRRDLNLAEFDLPQSLRLVIGRRLARLSEDARKILGPAAVIRRSFTFELLEASTNIDADSLLDYVEEAEKAGLIYSTLGYPEASFQFSHELIRQAVLSDLSAPRRQRLHLNVVNGIERVHANALEDQAGDLAHHLWQAGRAADADKTLQYLALAAAQALKQSAYEGALRYFHNALELLKGLPYSEQRARRELEIQIDYGVALLATKGWYAPEMGSAYRRARELCQSLDDDLRLFSVLSGLWSFHLVRGEHTMACGYADEMVRLAPRLHNDGMLVQADWASGCSRFFKGQFAEARASLERGIGLYDRQKHRLLAFQFGQDPCVSCLCFDAMTLWILGYPDQAERQAQQAITLARELGYPFTLTWCLSMFGKYYTMRRDYFSANVVIEEGLELTKEYGFAFFEASLIAYRIIGSAAQGKIDEMTAGGGVPAGFSGAGYELAHTWARSAIAEALGSLGQVEIGIATLAEAREVMDRNDERYVESEIHRIRGDLKLNQVSLSSSTPSDVRAAQSEAEQSFLRAIEIAHQRDARSLELRAAISLSRMYIDSGKDAQALAILQPIHDWFTEGFDWPELKTANGILVDLKSASTSAANPKRATPSLAR
ncbi:MAG TPA: AAA family ATPase [Candidatus Binatus sp.]|uniref:ATP-binding protein n=1 Tax=Candidatus Binatus sp. TaxID=2811406 RepID=UPI002B483A3B|nr:AAA family ATPase [Candidatus Binatus sp.]HKN11558.1 AAA family ATPase [Candidatus Binatus sp.]